MGSEFPTIARDIIMVLSQIVNGTQVSSTYILHVPGDVSKQNQYAQEQPIARSLYSLNVDINEIFRPC